MTNKVYSDTKQTSPIINCGDILQIETDFYICARVDAENGHKFALIGLMDGNRWSRLKDSVDEMLSDIEEPYHIVTSGTKITIEIK